MTESTEPAFVKVYESSDRERWIFEMEKHPVTDLRIWRQVQQEIIERAKDMVVEEIKDKIKEDIASAIDYEDVKKELTHRAVDSLFNGKDKQ